MIGKNRKLFRANLKDKIKPRKEKPLDLPISDKECILSKTSPFYRCSNEDVIDDEDKLVRYPDALQLNFEDLAFFVNTDQVEYISHERKGKHKIFEDTQDLSNPESFVDTDLSLSFMDNFMFFGDPTKDEEEVDIWTRINSSVSKEHYL